MGLMVERMAIALHTAHYARGRGLGPSWSHLDRFEKEMWLFSARAALEEMREPTVEMISAVGSDYGPALEDNWKTMIDAALEKTAA